jgi:hypothetical protein
MSEGTETEHWVHCPKCGTSVPKKDLGAAVDAAETHDENLHGGDQVTLVDGMTLPSDEVVEAAQEVLEKIDDVEDLSEVELDV